MKELVQGHAIRGGLHCGPRSFSKAHCYSLGRDWLREEVVLDRKGLLGLLS